MRVEEKTTATCKQHCNGTIDRFFLFSSDVPLKCCLLTVELRESFYGFKCQLIGCAGCALGIKEEAHS